MSSGANTSLRRALCSLFVELQQTVKKSPMESPCSAIALSGSVAFATSLRCRGPRTKGRKSTPPAQHPRLAANNNLPYTTAFKHTFNRTIYLATSSPVNGTRTLGTRTPLQAEGVLLLHSKLQLQRICRRRAFCGLVRFLLLQHSCAGHVTSKERNERAMAKMRL